MKLSATDMQAITELTGVVAGAMLAAIQRDERSLPWNHAIYAVILAVKAVSGIAMEVEGLEDDEVKQTVMDAITAALTTDVHAMRCESAAELDEFREAMEQRQNEVRH